MADPDPTDRNPRPNGPSWAAAGAAFELAGSVGGGCLLGFFFDRWQNTAPWGLLGGALLGMSIGMAALIRMAFRGQDPK